MDFSGVRSFQQSLLERGIPCCELIVCRQHEVLYHECMGECRPGELASPTDRYFLYSCTKPVTAVAAMQCMEQHLFALDDCVADYLPEFADVMVRTQDGCTQKVSAPVTIRHLLTMTAGMDYALNAAEPICRLYETTGGHADTFDMARAIAQKPLQFEPGSRYLYGLCLDVLGAVIEKVSGADLEQWMKRCIFEPLGMKNTRFYLPGRMEARLADQYLYDAEAARLTLMPPENDLVRFDRFFSGGAGLVSTALDYIRFADALACGTACNGYRLLTEDSFRLMSSNQIERPEIQSSFTCTCGEEYGYGLGVRTRIAKADNALGSLGEIGWDGAAGADLLVDAQTGLSAVLMQHVRGWPSLLGSFHLPLRDSIYAALEKE